MTEQKLPTAAVVQAWYTQGATEPTSYDVELIGQENQPTTADIEDLNLEFSDGDELVRRKDVEQLIQNKIEKMEKHEKLPDRSEVRILKALLEEVQNQ